MATDTEGTADTSDAPAAHRRATMADVAALAGVGVKTVSRVVNGERYVSAAVAERVHAAAATLHYRPNPHAGRLRRKRPRNWTIGLSVSNTANPFDAELHRVIEDAARERGAAVFASSTDEDPVRERAGVEAFLARRLDALILTPVQPDQSHIAVEQRSGLPVVYIDRVPRSVTADVVVSDNAGGAAEATRHLLAHGHRRIAFLCDRLRLTTAAERLRGFRDAVRAAGVAERDAPVVAEVHSIAEASAAVTALLRGDRPPTAILSGQNLITVGAVRALHTAGVQHRLAFVGFDDVALGDALDPPITVVCQDPLALGRTAAERVFARLDGAVLPATEFVFPTRLVVRGSGEIPPPA